MPLTRRWNHWRAARGSDPVGDGMAPARQDLRWGKRRADPELCWGWR